MSHRRFWLFASMLVVLGCSPALIGPIGSGNLPCATALLTCSDLGSSSSYTALGCGTASYPYVLCTGAQIAGIASHSTAWASSYQLGKNIDLSGVSLTPIGTSSTPFTGKLDGNGKTLSNFTYTNAATDGAGLFGYVTGSASEIKNLTLSNVSVTGHDYVGALVGRSDRASILGVAISSGSVTGHNYVGGILGLGERATVLSASSSAVSVTGTGGTEVGGLVGRLGTLGFGDQGGLIYNSYATGNVSGTSICGGLVGQIGDSVQIFNSFAAGSVTTTAGVSAGGLVGDLAQLATEVFIENSFATGNIAPSAASSGRLYGTKNGTYNGTNNGSFSGSTCASCHAATTNETPHAPITYFYSSGNAPLTSWNFAGVWMVCGTFPLLTPTYLNTTTWGSCAAHTSDTPFAGGIGTPEDPYLICTTAQLANIMTNVAYYHGAAFKLMANLDMTSQAMANFPIGYNANPFQGVFDGNGKTISKVTLNTIGDTQGSGLFGWAIGIIKRLAVTSANMTSDGSMTGIVVGQMHGVVTDVYTTGSVSGTRDTGGVAGNPQGDSLVINSYSLASVTTYSFSASNVGPGGISGDPGSVVVTNCFFAGTITDSFAADGGKIFGGDGSNAEDGTTSYYSSSTSCTGCSGGQSAPADGNPINTTTNPTYFYKPANAPLSQWDFSTIWTDNSATAAYPTLR